MVEKVSIAILLVLVLFLAFCQKQSTTEIKELEEKAKTAEKRFNDLSAINDRMVEVLNDSLIAVTQTKAELTKRADSLERVKSKIVVVERPVIVADSATTGYVSFLERNKAVQDQQLIVCAEQEANFEKQIQLMDNALMDSQGTIAAMEESVATLTESYEGLLKAKEGELRKAKRGKVINTLVAIPVAIIVWELIRLKDKD